MLNTKLIPMVNHYRQLGTSSKLGFRFKLTEKLSREIQENQTKEEVKPKEWAVTTTENPLLMGKVSHDRQDKVVKIGVPKHRLNDHLLLYVRENDNVFALDENDICKPGDWVLIRQDSNLVDKDVKHKVEKVVHSFGNYIDPITNRRCLGIYYEDDLLRLEKIKMDL